MDGSLFVNYINSYKAVAFYAGIRQMLDVNFNEIAWSNWREVLGFTDTDKALSPAAMAFLLNGWCEEEVVPRDNATNTRSA